MTNYIAKNIRHTRPMLYRFSLALGMIYFISGVSTMTRSAEQIIREQPQQSILIGWLGNEIIGIISILLGLTHFYGLFRKSYRATLAAYIFGMAYLTMWSASYLFLIPTRPGATAAGLAATLTFMYLTLGAIRERVQVHNEY